MFAKVWDRMFSKEERRILMVGLDAAGKTTILYKCAARSLSPRPTPSPSFSPNPLKPRPRATPG